eukprot:Em0010g765a
MLLFCSLYLSLCVFASDAHVLPTQTQTVLQATPSPVPNYIPPNSNTSFEPYLLFTTPHSINQIRPNGRNIRVVIPELGNADAVDFDIRRGSMCWSVISRRKIACSKLDGSEQFDVLSTASRTIDAIAVDWITQKLYWADAEAKQILVLDLKTRLGKVIANTGNQTLPRSLVVDPTERRLYWSDCGSRPKIESLSMDGADREILHSTGLGSPNALTIDYGTQTLYWTDSVMRDIESSSTDGSGRRIVTSAVFWPYSITLSADSLYWTDWEYNAVFQAPISGRNTSFLISGLSSRPKGIRYISYDRQPAASNPCEVNNGECSHLCLLSSASPSNYTCGCPEGYLSTNANQSRCIAPNTASNLSGSCVAAGYQSCCTSGLCLGYLGDCSCDIDCYDHGTCCADINQTCSSGPPPYVIFSDNNSLYNMDPDGSNLQVVLTGLSGASALDFDYRQGYMYWTELDPPAIWKSAINGSFKQILVNNNLSTPAGIAADWVSNKIYWTDEGLSTIEVLDPVSNRRRVLFSTSSSSSPGLPRAIVLDPITRWMYWTDWSSVPMIGRASMDGTNRTVVQDYNLGFPNALALDYATQRLYWGDAGLTQLESSFVDGSDRQVLYQNDELYPYSMVLFGKTLYISNWIGMRVVTVGTRGVNNMEVLYSDPEYNPRGIRVVNRNIQNEGTNPCALNNGGCTHLCLLSSVQEAGFTCACPDGTTLNITQGICESGPPSPPPTPTLQGSCKLAGYTACCPTSNCIGSPQEADCYCDHSCYKLHDCCPDILETCPLLLSSAIPTPSSTSTVFANTTVGIVILSTPTASHLITTDKYTNTISTSPSSRPKETQRDYTTEVLATTIASMVIILLLLVLILGVSIALCIHGHTVSQLTYSQAVTDKPLVQAQQLG